MDTIFAATVLALVSCSGICQAAWSISQASDKPVQVGSKWEFKCGFSSAKSAENIDFLKRKNKDEQVAYISNGLTVTRSYQSKVSVTEGTIPSEYSSQGGTLLIFTITAVDATDAGQYTCEGESSKNWKTLTVKGPVTSVRWQFKNPGTSQMTVIGKNEKVSLDLSQVPATPKDSLQCVVETEFNSYGSVSVKTASKNLLNDGTKKAADVLPDSCPDQNCAVTKTFSWYSVIMKNGFPFYAINGELNNKNITCTASNPDGSAPMSKSIILSLEYPPEREKVLPKKQRLVAGTDVKFVASFYANPIDSQNLCEINWFFSKVPDPQLEKNDLKQLNDTITSVATKMTGEMKTSTLTLMNVTKSSVGYYHAKFCNKEMAFGQLSSSPSAAQTSIILSVLSVMFVATQLY
ncbi:uncharacterized protein LOC141911824 [Tubulanus polymorphus]|uniref:uncharacterized protein LOC141911824 n=1 Tax=Tubulanus polymorphus TaxID=672921 RepID=UPI003DA52E15